MPTRKQIVFAMATCLVFMPSMVAKAQSSTQAIAKYGKVFAKFDTNGNRTLDASEWVATPRLFRERARSFGFDTSREIKMDSLVYGLVRRAARTLETLDRNRDGSLDGAEFARSRSTRGMFEDAGVDVTKAYPREKFIEVYLRLIAGEDLSKKRRTRERTRLTLDLPETYLEHDRDEDNQIGLYEWPRSRYTEFFRLDHNGDGFLTPKELHRAEKENALIEKADAGKSASTPRRLLGR